MAAVVTLLGSSFNTTSGTHTVVASPAVGDLIIIIRVSTGLATEVIPTDDNNSGTYSLIVGANKAAGADRMAAFVRKTLITASVSTTFTEAAGTTTGGGLAVYGVSGMGVADLAATPQWGSQGNQTTTSTPAPVMFSGVPKLTSAVIGAVFNSASPASMTPRTGYTEDVDTGYSTPTTGFQSMHRNSGETSATITWGSTAATAWCSLAVELAPLTSIPNKVFGVSQSINRSGTY